MRCRTLVRDIGGAGSFFSTVDVALVPDHIQWAREHVSRPGLVTWSNNALDWSHMYEGPARNVGTEQCFMNMGGGHQLIAQQWGKPAAMLICAGGFTFHGERSWFNERIFLGRHRGRLRKDGEPVPRREVLFRGSGPDIQHGRQSARQGRRAHDVSRRRPACTVAPARANPALRQPGLCSSDRTARFARRRGRATARAFATTSLRAGGRSTVSQPALDTRRRSRCAQTHLRARAAPRRRGRDRGVRVRRVGLRLRARRRGDPRAAYVAGWECWATDMLAVLNGEIGPIALDVRPRAAVECAARPAALRPPGRADACEPSAQQSRGVPAHLRADVGERRKRWCRRSPAKTEA